MIINRMPVKKSITTKSSNNNEISNLSLQAMSVSNRNEVIALVNRLYRQIMQSSPQSSVLNTWANKLVSKQVTLYSYLITLIKQSKKNLTISSLVDKLYVGVINRKPSLDESSKIIFMYNENLRNYGSQDRALRNAVEYFVRTSTISRYCNNLSIINI